jgi:5-methylcytosine-specific restriction endonuclease McrA
MKKKEFKEAVLAADDYKCQSCIGGGCTWLATEPHHIVFRSQGGKNELSNGISLCPVCHEFAHGRGNLRHNDDRLSRVTGRQFMIDVLEKLKDSPRWRWDEAYEWLKNREGL